MWIIGYEFPASHKMSPGHMRSADHKLSMVALECGLPIVKKIRTKSFHKKITNEDKPLCPKLNALLQQKVHRNCE